MTEPTIPVIDWERLWRRSPPRVIGDAIILGILLGIGTLLFAGLRVYCVLWRGEHVWDHYPGDLFTPARESECRCCGARQPYRGPVFQWDDEE